MRFAPMSWLAAFLIVELFAAFSEKRGDTLSENVWHWFGVRGNDRPASLVRRCAMFAFMVSLGAHFVFGTTVGPVIGFGAVVGAVIIFSTVKERK